MVDKITGEVVMKESELQPNLYLLNNNTVGVSAMHHFAQARGHLLVLTLQHMVYAFDLVARKKLWEYNLFGDNAFLSQNVQQMIQQADGSMQLVYADGLKLRIGQNAVVESSYVCMPERDGLVARARDPQDRRRNVVSLTPAGKTALKRLDKRIDAAQSTLLEPLSAKERRDVIRLLERVVSNRS